MKLHRAVSCHIVVYDEIFRFQADVGNANMHAAVFPDCYIICFDCQMSRTCSRFFLCRTRNLGCFGCVDIDIAGKTVGLPCCALQGDRLPFEIEILRPLQGRIRDSNFICRKNRCLRCLEFAVRQMDGFGVDSMFSHAANSNAALCQVYGSSIDILRANGIDRNIGILDIEYINRLFCTFPKQFFG